MSEADEFGTVDAAGMRADRPASLPTEHYAAPRLLEVGSTTRLIRGGGGGSGQDCKYYWYYSSGPYGC